MVHFPRSTRRKLPQAGMVIIAIIALLAVATMLLGVGARTVLQEHRQIRQREHSIQSRRMAEAGLARAAALLAADEKYEGDVWEIATEQLGGKHAGRVTIRLDATDSEDPLLIATAEFPVEGVFRSTTTLEQSLFVGKPSPQISPNETLSGDDEDES